MIHHDVIHGSPEWFNIRLGLATASCFGKIVTPERGDFSKQAEKYAYDLIGELITGQSAEDFQSYWMERGAQMEGDAAASYGVITDYQMVSGGFITNDDMTFGCSPDTRIIDSTGKVIGAAEIKCPKIGAHLENFFRDISNGEIDPKYKPQVQGQILVGGFEFNDWVSYFPDVPPVIIRTHRDDKYCEKLAHALKEFQAMLDDKIETLMQRGVLIQKRPILDFHNRPTKPQTIGYMCAG